MRIVRDSDVTQGEVDEIFKDVDLFDGKITSSEKISNVPVCKTDFLVFVTKMRIGWLGYHQKFFENNKKYVHTWVILLLNDDPVVLSQLKNHCIESSSQIHIIQVEGGDENLSDAISDLAKIVRLKANKVLLYSIKPNCGKKSLALELQDKMPLWEFECAEEKIEDNILEDTDAGQIIIVGKTIKDFDIELPDNTIPYYVLTMPDRNPQSYISVSELVFQMLNTIPQKLNWTKEIASNRLFFVSPLYERWRIEGNIPLLDHRFVMWDKFGLPLTRELYTEDNVRTFLSQFNQIEILTQHLTSTRTEEEYGFK